jgi:hypothetical protein
MQNQEPSEEQEEATHTSKSIINQGTTTLFDHNAQVHPHMLQRENKAEERLPKKARASSPRHPEKENIVET